MKRHLRKVAFLGILVSAGAGCQMGTVTGNPSVAPLSGRVQSASGESLGGVPLQARRPETNMAVVVYTNKQGEYAYPEDLSPGLYGVNIQVSGFQHVTKEGVNVTKGKPTRLDFSLEPATPPLSELTASEVLLSLPGTDKIKAEAARCSNCHSLQFALGRKRDRATWLQTIERMRGITPSGVMQAPEVVRPILQQTAKTNQELADFMAAVASPDSPPLPAKLLPRPTDDASTRITITEYFIPRGAVSVTLRGDTKGAWLHDVLPDGKGNIWYTDHFANVLGRLDPKSGEIKEFRYAHSKPGKQEGALQHTFDKQGNIWLGVLWQGTIGKFDPRTEKFNLWTIAEDARLGMVAMDSSGNAWAVSSPTSGVYKLDPKTGKFTKYPIPTQKGAYGMGIDSKDRVYFCEMEAGKIGRFDPKTEKFTEWDTPTPDSGPRRLDIDAQDRFWFGEFYAGKIGMFDPKTETIREWAIPGNPYAAPYDVAVDNKGNAVWANDFNNNRVYRFDVKTEKFTEFLLPEPNVEIRHLFVDDSTTPSTVWIPDYSPPGKILKLQAW